MKLRFLGPVAGKGVTFGRFFQCFLMGVKSNRKDAGCLKRESFFITRSKVQE